MEEFSKHLLNAVLNLFLDQTNRFAQASNFHSKFNCEYIQKPLNNQGLKVTVSLIPKTSSLPMVEVIRFEVVHSLKRQLRGRHHFTDISLLLNDNSRNLIEALAFINKFFISACFLSPYINFYNTRSLDLDYLKRKYSLDYKVEYKSSIEAHKPTVNNQETRQFSFRRYVENSLSHLDMQLHLQDNLGSVLLNLRNAEKVKAQKFLSGKTIRNRFFSEDNDDFSRTAKARKHQDGKLHSEMDVKNSFERRSTGLANQKEVQRPFKLLDEVIMDNLEENSCEEEDTVPIKEPLMQHTSRKNGNCSIFFTEANLSFRSKTNKTENKGSGFEAEAFEFDDVPSIDNLYYMVTKLRKAIKFSMPGTTDDHSYSSTSHVTTPASLLNQRKDSIQSFTRKGIITFHN